MGDFFPSQKKSGTGCGPIAFIMGPVFVLMGLVVVFLMAQGSGFFEAIFQVFVFIYEVIDELWEK